MMSRINQDSPSHQATISYCTLSLSNCCSIKHSPLCDPVIRLTRDAAGQGEQAISRPVTLSHSDARLDASKFRLLRCHDMLDPIVMTLSE